MGKIDKILIGTLMTMVIVLLIGHRFNTTWAGGTGYAPHHAAQPKLERGESATATNEFATYSLNNSQIFLDRTTTITLLDGRENNTSWRLDTGRVVVKGKADLHIRNLAIHIDGLATLVHYSWMDRVDVLLLSGSGSINNQALFANQAVSISTATPGMGGITPENIAFSLSTPAVQAFYDWALSTAMSTYAQ